jgi:SAM-dependent methyltransferase
MPNGLELDEINRDYWQVTGTGNAKAKNELMELARHRVNYLLQELGSLDGIRIVDIGAGHAFPYDAIKEKGHTAEYFAVESDKSIRSELEGKGVSVVETMTELGDQKFDLAILSHVVEHVTDPVDLLQSVASIVKTDGSIFVEVPNQDDQFKMDLGLHLGVYNPKAIGVLCQASGLNPKSIMTVGQSIKDLRPDIVSRVEHKLKRTNSKIHFFWRGFTKRVLVWRSNIQPAKLIDRNDEEGRWLRVIAKK